MVTINEHGHILKGTTCIKCGLDSSGEKCNVVEGTSLKLWLDDLRRMPVGYSVLAKTVEEAISWLQARVIWHVSLDHDLADEHYEEGTRLDNLPYNEGGGAWDRSKFTVKTGYAVLEWMRDNDAWVPDIQVHSLSSGGNDMMAFMRKHAPEWVEFRRVKPKEIA